MLPLLSRCEDMHWYVMPEDTSFDKIFEHWGQFSGVDLIQQNDMAIYKCPILHLYYYYHLSRFGQNTVNSFVSKFIKIK